ncbi:MAG: hypothetical protein ACJ77M_17590 [Thermoleophilaceae bacterium]|jgi:hypothetical protein
MASRKEEKERLRQERMEREQAEKAAAARRRRMIYGGGILAGVVIVVVAIAIASGGGSSKSSGSSPDPSKLSAGLQTGPAPWQPEYTHLADRFEASGLPQSGTEQYHIHALLRIYVSGKQQPVPANIGIDPSGQFLAALHTHDTSGIIHMESDNFFPFKLGQFFDIWGVKFTDSQLGAYYNQGQNTVQVYVNGKKVADPVNYELKRHDTIVVAYGKPGSFPTKIPANFPNGL